MANSSQDGSQWANRQEPSWNAAAVSAQLRGDLANLWNKAVMRSEDEFREVEAKRVIWQNRMDRDMAKVVANVEDMKKGLHTLQQELSGMARSAKGPSKSAEPEASTVPSFKTLESKRVMSNAPPPVVHQPLLENSIKQVESMLSQHIDGMQERFDELYHMHAGHNACLDEIMRGIERNRETTEGVGESVARSVVPEEPHGDPLLEFNKVPKKPSSRMSKELNMESTTRSDEPSPTAYVLPLRPTQSTLDCDEVEQEVRQSNRSNKSALRKSSVEVAMAAGRLHSFTIHEDLNEGNFRLQHHLQTDVLLRYIQRVSFVLILLNMIYMGIILDTSIQDVLQRRERITFAHNIEYFFSGAFLLEILLRLALEKRSFFWGPNTGWNCFDSCVVISQLWQTFSVSSQNIGVLRLGRLAKLSRAVRMLRTLQHFRFARLIVDAEVWQPIVMGLTSLIAFLYVFSLVVTSGVATAIEDRGPDNLPAKLVQLYGSVTKTMITLFMACTGGDSWGELSRPLEETAVWLKWAILFFQFFILFGLAKTVTAMYVDAFIYCSNLDRMMTDKKASDKQRLKRLRDMLLDKVSDHLLGYQDMCSVLRNEGAPILKKLGYDVTVAQAIFKLLDAEDRELVDLDEFIHSMLHLKGNAQTIYLATVQNQCNKLLAKVTRLTVLAEEQLPLVAALHGSPPSDKDLQEDVIAN